VLQLLLRSFMFNSSSSSSSSPKLDNAAILQLFLETYFTELLSSASKPAHVSVYKLGSTIEIERYRGRSSFFFLCQLCSRMHLAAAYRS
jgi:hypothetical protein